MAPVNAKEIIEKHQFLENEQREIQTIESTSIWQRMETENREAANLVFEEMAFGVLPTEPTAALTKFFELRAEVKSRLLLINIFTAIKNENAAELGRLLGSARKTAPDQEESDLDAGTVY